MAWQNHSPPSIRIETEQQLASYIAQFRYRSLDFVMAVFPWGEPTLKDGSFNPLKDKKGPEVWQRRLLQQLDKMMIENALRKKLDLDYLVSRFARASGHGVGKSSLVAWLILFFMSTRPDCRGVVTSNTSDQLERKTWPELGKWHDLALNKHWFQRTATAIHFAAYPQEKQKNYMFTAHTVSPENTEAFAGLHNEQSAVVMIMDEASGIDAKVTEVAEGAMTDGEPFMFKFGNPTRPDGDFYDCFTKPELKDMYDLGFIDSREVSFTNKVAINDMIRKWGVDSDEVKVRVYGQFPRQAFDGFINPSIVTEAMTRELWLDDDQPLLLGVDVARYGDDRTVLYPRQGRDARNLRPREFKGLNTREVAQKVADFAMDYQFDAIIVESLGPGAGVIDNLRSWGYRVIEIHPGAPCERTEPWDRVRSKIWSRMRDWIYEGGCLANDQELFTELTKIQYGLDPGGETKLRLEPKRDMKKRIGNSPDKADALALTFAAPQVRKRDDRRGRPLRNVQAEIDYDMAAA